MSEGSPSAQIVRARAVADAPVEQLLAHVEELARRWVIAQFATRSLREMGDVPLAQLARGAPALCEQLIRALGSDAELALLLSGEDGAAHERGSSGASASRVLAIGASDASSVVASVESLRSVLWREMLVELREPSATLVADLADRLAFVCASVLATTIGVHAHAHQPDALAARPHDGGSARASRARHDASAAERGSAVLIDELDDSRSTARATRLDGSPDAALEPDASDSAHGARARPWDTPLRGDAGEPPSFADGPTISRREDRSERDSLWRVGHASSVPVDELR